MYADTGNQKAKTQSKRTSVQRKGQTTGRNEMNFRESELKGFGQAHFRSKTRTNSVKYSALSNDKFPGIER